MAAKRKKPDVEEPVETAEEEIPTESPEELFGSYMASLGFSPKKPYNRGTLEFYKTYSDPTGRTARLILVAKEPTPEGRIDPDYFLMTLQMTFKPQESEISTKAPAFARQDMLRLLAFFETPLDRDDGKEVECAVCGAMSSSWTAREAGTVCLDCAGRVD